MERTRSTWRWASFSSWASWPSRYLSIKLGRVSLFGSRGYVVSADFPSSAGLKVGANVEIAGVAVGRVESIGLKNDQAHVVIRMQPQIKIAEDAIVVDQDQGPHRRAVRQHQPGRLGARRAAQRAAAGGRAARRPGRVDLQVRVRQSVRVARERGGRTSR